MDISKLLVDKSIEAFIVGVELYNKPTIKYRVEGFSFFICNAWELMLKAHIINLYGEKAIYYKDSEDRTITLELCVKKLFTDKQGALRKNIEKIIELRNTSTHFITEDYEYIYAPLFQACVMNFAEKIKEFHNKNITDYIAQNFLTLSVKNNFNTDEIKAKYSPNMVKKLLKEAEKINSEIIENNSEFAIQIQTHFFITKDKNKADIFVGVDKNSEHKMAVVKQLENPNNVYTYTTKDVIRLVNKKLKSKGIFLTKLKNGETIQAIFSMYDFNLFVNFYDIKNNPKFSFHYTDGGSRYTYSQAVVEFIADEIIKNPKTIIGDLKKNINKK